MSEVSLQGWVESRLRGLYTSVVWKKSACLFLQALFFQVAMHLSIFHRCTLLKQPSAAGSFLQMLMWLLSAQTLPGWGAPVAVRRSPALFLACITTGGICSGGGLASPVLRSYWWCEILMWRQPEIIPLYILTQMSLDCPGSIITLWFWKSFFPACTAITISWLQTSHKTVLHLSPQRFSLHFLAMRGPGYARRSAALGKSLPAFDGMLSTLKDAAHVTPTSL